MIHNYRCHATGKAKVRKERNHELEMRKTSGHCPSNYRPGVFGAEEEEFWLDDWPDD